MMTDEMTFLKQSEKTLGDDTESESRTSVLFWIVSVSAVSFVAISLWLNTIEIPELKDEISYQRDTIFSLTEEIDRLQEGVISGEQKVSRLEAQLTPFRYLARRWYGPDENLALSQLAHDVERLTKGGGTSKTLDGLSMVSGP